MDNLEEMHEFLEKYNLPKLSQEEIETVIKNFPTKSKDHMASQVNSTKNLEKS